MDRVFEKVWFLPPYLVARKTVFFVKSVFTAEERMNDDLTDVRVAVNKVETAIEKLNQQMLSIKWSLNIIIFMLAIIGFVLDR